MSDWLYWMNCFSWKKKLSQCLLNTSKKYLQFYFEILWLQLCYRQLEVLTHVYQVSVWSCRTVLHLNTENLSRDQLLPLKCLTSSGGDWGSKTWSSYTCYLGFVLYIHIPLRNWSSRFLQPSNLLVFL